MYPSFTVHTALPVIKNQYCRQSLMDHSFILLFWFSRYEIDLFQSISAEGKVIWVCTPFLLISIVHLTISWLLDVKWLLSGASGGRVSVVVFSCKLSASHEFFIHSKSRIEARRGDVCGYEMACTGLVLWSIMVSLCPFLHFSRCILWNVWIELNLFYWANMPKKISKYVKRSVTVASV